MNQHIRRVKSALLPLSDIRHMPLSSNVAAVFMGVSNIDAAQPRLLLTLRAASLRAHAGQVAFPGGKWECDDVDLVDTVLRETQEEIGLSQASITLWGYLPPLYSKGGIKVYPIVGSYDSNVMLSANADEIAEIFTAPLTTFMSIPHELMYRSFQMGEYVMPCWYHNNMKIWGLSAMFIELLLSPVLYRC